MSIIQGNSKTSAAAAYEISQSVRFNDNDSPSLTWTPGADASSQTTFTISMWFKRGDLSNNGALIAGYGGSGATLDEIRFNSGDGKIYFRKANVNVLVTTQVLRDPSAWYHLVLAVDTNDATSGDRYKLYLNGSRITAFDTATYPSSGATFTGFTKNVAQYVGDAGAAAGSFDGYLAEVIMIDGQALNPTSFGETNADTGQWVPVSYTGSYGTNGFYITGADSADLGADDSGNGNDFTSSGLTAADQMLDTPTNNFAVQNYITGDVDNLNWSEGNLNILADSSARWHTIPATIYPQSGKWGYQATIKSSTGFIMIGWMSEGDIEEGNVGGGKLPYSGSNSNTAFLYNTEAQKYVNNTLTFTGGLAGLATNDVVECLMDIDNGTISWKKNGSAYGPTYTGLNTTDNPLTVPMVAVFGGSSYRVELDYGQGGYTPSDSDYKTICTANLPDPTIADPSAYFQTTLYTGNGSTQEVNQSGNSTFEPGFVWIKTRSNAAHNALFDQVRGVNKQLRTDNTGTEYTAYSDLLTAFDADGFTLGADATVNNVNVNAYTYVAWQWLADGTTGSTNEDGSITSTVSANTTSGFSIVKYTGNSSASTVGHGLGVAPDMVIVKKRTGVSDWAVWNKNLSVDQVLILNGTAAAYNPSGNDFQDTAPTSSVFYITATTGPTNDSGEDFVAYCFAEVENFSKFGSYVGNGLSDGPMVHTGFRPAFVIGKRTDGTSVDWWLFDDKRPAYNLTNGRLYPNSTATENTGAGNLDFVSNGFKIRTNTSSMNSSGNTFIYMAFASSPFKTATAR